MLSCILRLRYTKDTNFIFFFSNFQFLYLYFQIDEQWGLISCTHQKVKLSASEKENHELKVENSALEERIDNLSYILADLQGKVKHTEEEKASLITAIRLLNNNQVSNDRVGEQIDANLAVDQDQQNRTSEHLQPNIPVNNSFMVLNVEETNTVNTEPSISVYSKQ